MEIPLASGRAAEMMAGEQPSGTLLKIPGETPDLIARHGAVVESVDLEDEAATPGLPGAIDPREEGGAVYTRAKVRISWPLENVGASLTNLFATVLGNLTELRELSGIRLLDVALPPSFIRACPGPAHGIAGTRRLAAVQHGPLIGTIIKPSVGLSPEETARQVQELIDAGLDFIKDDELIASPPYSPLEKRLVSVTRVLNGFAERTCRKPMYAFYITGDIHDLRRRHDLVREACRPCVMVSVNWVGVAYLVALRRHAALPIHGHRNGWGMFTRAPLLGMEYTAYQKLLRLAGADHLHVNGLGNKFFEADESVIASARACLTPLANGEGRDDRAMPVFSSAQTAVQAPETFERLGSADLIYTCGGGIMGHPDGVAAGCRSVRAAWEAAMEGIPLVEYARREPALAAAIDAFGPKTGRMAARQG
jgi:ribulose-bisphosphate carboxylase large chain